MGPLAWVVGGFVAGAVLRSLNSPSASSSQIQLPQVKNQGVPFASPTGRVWPVVNGDKSVPYTISTGAVIGNGAVAFGASREDGLRKHAGIDLQASPGQRIVAMEDGVVLGSAPGFVKLDAVVIQHSSVVAVYAEVALGALKSAGLSVGSKVKAGQFIATAAMNYEGNSMLHLELWRTSYAPKFFTPWYRKDPPPTGLLDPTIYLMQLAKE